MCLTVRPRSQLKVSTRSTLTSCVSPLRSTLSLYSSGLRNAFDVKKRLAAPALHVEHVGEEILLPHFGVGRESNLC